jgi:hypothetical protein
MLDSPLMQPRVCSEVQFDPYLAGPFVPDYPSQRREGWGTRSFCGWLRVAGRPMIITSREKPQHLSGNGLFQKPARSDALGAGTSYPSLESCSRELRICVDLSLEDKRSSLGKLNLGSSLHKWRWHPETSRTPPPFCTSLLRLAFRRGT